MPLLAEYAITPDVFDSTSYSSEEVCGLHLSTIRQVMMDEGLLRDLRGGEWRALFASRDRPWHRRAKEIVKKLATQGRLIEFPPTPFASPTNDREWCAEALAGHQREPMAGGVIVTQPVKDAYRRERLVERVDLLSRAEWWEQRSPSVRLHRELAEYRQHLNPILRCANSFQFIDPHLYPGRRGYREFAKILARAGGRKPAPLIEIHRVRYDGSGSARTEPDFQSIFQNALSTTLHVAGLRANVFIWDHFHDRYLITNLVGISLPNGFDTTHRRDDLTTWTRLGPAQRDDIQREFDSVSRSHILHRKFTLP